MASLTTCCSLGAWTPAGFPTPIWSRTRPAAPPSSWTPAPRSSLCSRRSRSWRVTPTHVLRTHAHPDHVEHEGELDLPVVRHSLETGDLWIDAIPTPGHSDDMVCFVINDHAVFSGDTLFKDAVGGGDFEQVKGAVMDVYMPMPHDRRVLPGHTDETTIGREWEQNPFVRVWRGSRARGSRAGARCGPRCHPRRVVARLRRQGQGLGALRRRQGCDRRRLTGGAELVEIVDPRIEAYAERVSSPHDPLLAELSAATTPRARPGRDAHRPGRRSVPRAARLDRPAAPRARDRDVQRALGARDGRRPARRRAHRCM